MYKRSENEQLHRDCVIELTVNSYKVTV